MNLGQTKNRVFPNCPLVGNVQRKVAGYRPPEPTFVCGCSSRHEAGGAGATGVRGTRGLLCEASTGPLALLPRTQHFIFRLTFFN